MRDGIAWVILGAVLGAVSIIDPLGMLLAIIVLGVITGWKLRTMAPGLSLAGAGAGAAIVIAVLGHEYPSVVPPGLASTLGVVIVGGLWAYFNSGTSKRRRSLAREGHDQSRNRVG